MQVTGTLGVSPGQQLSAFVGFAGSPATAATTAPDTNGGCTLNDPATVSQGGGYGGSTVGSGTTRAAARHTRSAAVRYCTAVVTAPPQGLG